MSFFKKFFGKSKEEQIDASSVQEEKLEQELLVEDEVLEEKEKAEEVQEEILKETTEKLTMGSADILVNDEVSVDKIEVLEEILEADLETNDEALAKTDEEEVENATKLSEETEKKGFIKRLFGGLTKTRDSILKGVDDVLSNFRHIDEDLYEELEEALIMADFGVETTLHIMESLKEKVKQEKITEPSALKVALQEIITKLLTDQPREEILNPNGPTVILVIGVNGVGKTTSIGKMSHLFKSQHKKVLVAAADTFRAAAIEQLQVWVNRAGVDLIKHEEGTDAAAVVFDAIAAAKSRKSDVLICDTAGRLQNKTNLMKELEKISRIIAREYPEAKKEILIVLDATTGQNAIQQVKLFKEVADINGIILTKLDGTAKGGAIVGIYESLKVPVKYIGVGEQINDLQPFDAEIFATALFKES
ncbi:signal recognition particle-docking protein FtsY [Cellulosilyticum lentocellum DSM 5427]|uniref:Signal recognition particle receptor FtsY n=1 Tax=Cellulosilyticum lentocellum (strain ATCC 49066 / DSM 5427 / NCIMB 11756 / RHM5) TaxID=642492 RepID=F2JS79_CELLD|nr:signal recognition particle-docking protein FtsY [Cellulosilyticum lentocellum]ADZ84016.1 signal recognition particle-docking protein FtsY [Cellulosilyticum lentocellum DSM 5427]